MHKPHLQKGPQQGPILYSWPTEAIKDNDLCPYSLKKTNHDGAGSGLYRTIAHAS